VRRSPAKLHQNDVFDCSMCVAANILYMFHVIDSPDVNWVNEQIGRQTGDSTWKISPAIVLLNQGLSLYSISEYSNQLFLAHGTDYLKHYYKDIWNEEWDDIPPELIASEHALAAHMEEEIAAKNLPRYLDVRQPTIEDVLQLVQMGCAVSLAVNSSSGPYSHAVLVHNVREMGGRMFVNVYDPAPSGPIFFGMSASELEKHWDGFWVNAWWRLS
jgi:hypothetical protein